MNKLIATIATLLVIIAFGCWLDILRPQGQNCSPNTPAKSQTSGPNRTETNASNEKENCLSIARATPTIPTTAQDEIAKQEEATEIQYIAYIGFFSIAIIVSVIAYHRSVGNSGQITATATVAAFFGLLLYVYFTGQQNELTRESFTAVQRAFVVVSELRDVSETTDAAGHVSFVFAPVIINTGNTPTKDMEVVQITPFTNSTIWSLTFAEMKQMNWYDERRQYAGQLAAPPDPAELFNFSPPPDMTRFFIQKAVLGPHATFPESSSDLFNGRIMSSNEPMPYFYGAIRYRDVFPNTPLHITEYCYSVSGIMIEVGRSHPPITLCPHWNCADEECTKDRAEYDKELAAAPKVLEEREKEREKMRVQPPQPVNP